MKRLHEWGGTPSRRSQKLRKTVRRIHEIRTSDCSKAEQDRLLKELHMEVHVL